MGQIINTLKSDLMAARVNKDNILLGIISLVLGEVNTQQGRTGKESTDEQVEKIIRGIRDKNTECLSLLVGKNRPDDEAKLKKENDYLNTLLPNTLTPDEIANQLRLCKAPMIFKSEGEAMGHAMKYFKGQGLKVLGQDVKKALQIIRQEQEIIYNVE